MSSVGATRDAPDRRATTRVIAKAGSQPIEVPNVPGFTVLRRLGSGSMGEVFQARHHASGNIVALKLVSRWRDGHPEWVRRFRNEVELVRRVRHPHVAAAVADGEWDGRPWLAVQFIEGLNLDEVLRGSGPMPEGDVLAIARQIAELLGQIHAETGLVHCDIKPANLILTSPAAPGVEPFGLAHCGIASGGESGVAIIGTPNYMAPEQIQGAAEIGAAVDLYGLGCTMFHLLTGQPPFTAPTPALVMSAHLLAPVPDPGDVVAELSPATRELVMTAMAKRPEERVPGHAAFVRACEEAQRERRRQQSAMGGSGQKPVRARSATAELIGVATAKVRQRHRIKTTRPLLPVAPELEPSPDGAEPGRKPWIWLILALSALVVLLLGWWSSR
jgi:serine/threonine protein kinase